MKLIIRWIIIALSLGVAVWLVPGIHVQGASAWIGVAVMAVVLGFVNAIIRPILKFLSCGCIILTLGLFLLVINALTFWLAAWISSNWFNSGFYVDSFWAALMGSIVVSIVSFLLSLLLPDEN
jgi:putative membrane protein